MTELIFSLLPLALGIVMSPLAIMALVAVLLSRQARRNGIAFLIGWALAIVIALGGSFLVLGSLAVHELASPPMWVPIMRLVLAALLIAMAWWIYRKGKARVAAMVAASTPSQVADAAAAPELPRWLRSVATFTPTRSFFLGCGIFLLNPVDFSCAVLAALDIRLAALDTTSSVVALVIFAVVGVLPIAIPVFVVLVRGTAADPLLARVRTWIASHTSLLNAALVLVIAGLQLQKAISTLLSY